MPEAPHSGQAREFPMTGEKPSPPRRPLRVRTSPDADTFVALAPDDPAYESAYAVAVAAHHLFGAPMPYAVMETATTNTPTPVSSTTPSLATVAEHSASLRTTSPLTAVDEEYVPSYVAARAAGVPSTHVQRWIRAGKVVTRPGPHGRLVQLADVIALADQASS